MMQYDAISRYETHNGTSVNAQCKSGLRIRHAFCLFGSRLNVPVNIFSVMSEQSHRFLGITRR